MKLTLFTIGLVAFLLNCSISGSSLFKAPSVPLAHQECSSNSECVLIQIDCSECDCGTPVNRNYELEYAVEKKNRCADYRGPVCDLLCPSTVSICKNGKCVEE